jgi:HNH endonuclease
MTTKDEILKAIQESAEELGRVPTIADLKRLRKIGLKTVKRYFGRYSDALREAGFEPQGAGYKLELETLVKDWMAIARKLGKVPSLLEYNRLSAYSVGPLIGRFGGWTEVPRGALQLVHEKGLEEEWEDVVAMLERHESCNRNGDSRSSAEKWKDAPLYGAPLTPLSLLHAPTNEMGVLYLLGALGPYLGLVVTRVQQPFPDLEVMREVSPGLWQRVPAEMEYESRNFLVHGHDPDKVALLVCWVHNWPECPVEVIELSQVLRRLRGAL